MIPHYLAQSRLGHGHGLASPPTPTAASFPFPPGITSSQFDFERTPTLTSDSTSLFGATTTMSMARFEFDSASSSEEDSGSSESEAELATPNSIPVYREPHCYFRGGKEVGVGVGYYSEGSLEETTRKLQQSLSLYGDDDGQEATPTPESTTLFPSFGDFLPPSNPTSTLNKAIRPSDGESFDRERMRYDLGVGVAVTSPKSRVATVDPPQSQPQSFGLGLGLDNHHNTSPPSHLNHIKEPRVQDPARKFAFRPFDSPLADSFTFYPAFPTSPPMPQQQQQQQRPIRKESTWVRADVTTPQSAYFAPRLSHSHSKESSLDMERPLTPPRSRTSSRAPGPGPPPSFPLPPLPSNSSSFFPATPPRSSSTLKKSHPLPLPSVLPPPFIPASQRSSPPSPPPPPSSSSTAYPLTSSETELVASLHQGRIPDLNQLAPTMGDAGSLVGAAPIVNTGNCGPMVVQQGDWECGGCGFVNWRRRKICMRCFPFANDIGNVLTIKSHAASMLATPSSSGMGMGKTSSRERLTPSPTHSNSTNGASYYQRHYPTPNPNQHQHYSSVDYHPQHSHSSSTTLVSSQIMSRSQTFPPTAPPPQYHHSSSSLSRTHSHSTPQFGPNYFYPAPPPTTNQIHSKVSRHRQQPQPSSYGGGGGVGIGAEVWNPSSSTSGYGVEGRGMERRNVVIYPALAV